MEEMDVMEPAYVVTRYWDCGIDSPYWEYEDETWFSSLVEAVVYFKKVTKSSHEFHRFVMSYSCDDLWVPIMYKV